MKFRKKLASLVQPTLNETDNEREKLEAVIKGSLSRDDDDDDDDDDNASREEAIARNTFNRAGSKAPNCSELEFFPSNIEGCWSGCDQRCPSTMRDAKGDIVALIRNAQEARECNAYSTHKGFQSLCEKTEVVNAELGELAFHPVVSQHIVDEGPASLASVTARKHTGDGEDEAPSKSLSGGTIKLLEKYQSGESEAPKGSEGESRLRSSSKSGSKVLNFDSHNPLESTFVPESVRAGGAKSEGYWTLQKISFVVALSLLALVCLVGSCIGLSMGKHE